MEFNQKDTLCIIARKYNDIFYSVCTDAWEKYNSHILIVVDPNNVFRRIPLEEIFDEVIILEGNIDNINTIFKTIIEVNKKIKFRCETLILSNPFLVLNQYITKRIKAQHKIFVEDGIMNYRDFIPSKSKIKLLTQFCLGINQTSFLKSIDWTYLFLPESAKIYFGGKKKLTLHSSILRGNREWSKQLEGKKLFIGTPLYKDHLCTIKHYSDCVNKVMEQYDIDFYVPHWNASNLEDIIAKKFNIEETNLTLEIISSFFNLEIYSFGSSVLYTTKLINKNTKSILINVSSIQTNYSPLYEQYCDEILLFNA